MTRFTTSLLISLVLALPAFEARARGQTAATPEAPAASAAGGSSSQAVVPRLMKFSGVLRDATGKPVTGPVDVTFALYSSDAGGDPLWFETQSVQADDEGRYTSLIGVMHTDGLPMDLFASGEARWLGVQVGNEAEQKPRVLLLSVPYALKAADAETLGGKPASSFLQTDAVNNAGTGPAPLLLTSPGTQAASTNQSKKTAPRRLTSGTGSTNYVAKWTDTNGTLGNSSIFDNGNVGIGTASPSFKLDILDNNASLTAFHLKNSNSGAGAMNQARLENDVGALAYVGITSSGFNQFAPINGGKAYWMSYATDAVFGNQSSNNIIFTQNGSETARFDASRRLGIGTTSPNAPLNVYSATANPGPVAFIQETAGSSNGSIGIGSSIGAGHSAFLVWNDSSNYLSLESYAAANPVQVRGSQLWLNPGGGNVGIWTTAPSATLEVNGTAKFDSTVTFPGSSINPASLSGGTAGISITGNAATATSATNSTSLGGVVATNYARLDVGNTFAANQSITGNVSATGKMLVGGTTAQQQNLILEVQSTPGNDALAVNSAGNVGIGTAMPTAALEVNGWTKFDQPVSFASGQTLSDNGNFFVGSGTPSNIPLEVQAGGQDALTVSPTGKVTIGVGSSGVHVTTAVGNTDFSGQIQLQGVSSNSHSFSQSPAFLSPPVCVVTPTSNLGATTWYVTVTTTQLTVTLSSGTGYVTFNYICVGNPN